MGENWLWVAIKKSKTDVQIGRKSRKMQQRERKKKQKGKEKRRKKKKKKWRRNHRVLTRTALTTAARKADADPTKPVLT